MKQYMGKDPVASFPMPASEPAALAPFRARFERVATEWATAKGELDDAREAVRAARAADARAVADAALEGRKILDSSKREREAAAAVVAAERRLEGLATACDEAGTEYVREAGSHLVEWAAAHGADEEALVGVIGDQLAGLADSLARLALARGSRRYLEDFDVSEAAVGRQRGFAGGRVTVDTTELRRESAVPVAEILAVLEQVFEEPKERAPRRHRVAVR
jgi:hypothetical protein